LIKFGENENTTRIIYCIQYYFSYDKFTMHKPSYIVMNNIALNFNTKKVDNSYKSHSSQRFNQCYYITDKKKRIQVPE